MLLSSSNFPMKSFEIINLKIIQIFLFSYEHSPNLSHGSPLPVAFAVGRVNHDKIGKIFPFMMENK